MSWKKDSHDRFNDKALERNNIKQGHSNPVCQFVGCAKTLTSSEYLYNDKYCFHHSSIINQIERAKYKLQDSNIYKAVLFKWNAANNVWDKIRVIIITLEQFTMKHNRDDFKEDNRVYYRYDLFVDFQCTDTIYSYSPAKFD